MSEHPLVHKPRIYAEIEVPELASRDTNVMLYPQVVKCKLTRNSYQESDVCTITITAAQGGVNVRNLRNADLKLWLWDEAAENYDRDDHLRFQGTLIKAARSIGDQSDFIELTFHDYTAFFLRMKPFPTRGMPQWNDTLREIWRKVCDNTGYYEPGADEVQSSVTIMRENLVLSDSFAIKAPNTLDRTLGELVPGRFHAVSKPTPKARTDAWAVWSWCLDSLGLISYIEGDRCIITDGPTYFTPEVSPLVVYGENIYDFREAMDSDLGTKGVVGKSFNPLTGQTLESFYPNPGDERIKVKKSAAKRAAKQGRDLEANDSSGEWIPFTAPTVMDQVALDRWTRNVYEQVSRQQIEGTFKTAEIILPTPDEHGTVNIFDLKAGDAINVDIHETTFEAAKQFDSLNDRIAYLRETCGYDTDMAHLIAKNIDNERFNSTKFHIMSIDYDIDGEAPSFEVEIKYQNVIILDD